MTVLLSPTFGSAYTNATGRQRFFSEREIRELDVVDNIRLQQALCAGEIANPPIKLVNGGHYPAGYNSNMREFIVNQAAADRAATHKDESWELFAALRHEFGHHIDVVLRRDLAKKNFDGSSTLAEDAKFDEGAK